MSENLQSKKNLIKEDRQSKLKISGVLGEIKNTQGQLQASNGIEAAEKKAPFLIKGKDETVFEVKAT